MLVKISPLRFIASNNVYSVYFKGGQYVLPDNSKILMFAKIFFHTFL
jgi:hypothetical protein